MTDHLTPDEFIAAVDGTLSGVRLRHLEACTACREEQARLAEVVLEIAKVDVPEPPAVFWDEFSARVTSATATDPMLAPAAWRVSRQITALGALAAGVLIAVLWAWPGTERPGASDEARGVESDGAGVPTWQTVADLASELSPDEARHVMALTPDTTLILSELSVDERAVFIDLFEREMGGAQ